MIAWATPWFLITGASARTPVAAVGRAAAAVMGASMTASVLPTSPAGQIGSAPGVPRYTAWTSSRGQAAGFLAKLITGQDAGTRTLTPPNVTLCHRYGDRGSGRS